MDSLEYLRTTIKSFYPQSAELQLSSRFAGQRRFNFYFIIQSGCPFLLYLNWDDGDRFTLKCLEFQDAVTVDKLVAAYPEDGTKTFNGGRPRAAVSFVYKNKDHLVIQDLRGQVRGDLHARDMSGKMLMECVSPL